MTAERSGLHRVRVMRYAKNSPECAVSPGFLARVDLKPRLDI
jgi:hypothetical protein